MADVGGLRHERVSRVAVRARGNRGRTPTVGTCRGGNAVRESLPDNGVVGVRRAACERKSPLRMGGRTSIVAALRNGSRRRRHPASLR
jgi:hypothetical protein